MPENIDLVMAVLFLTGGQLLLEGVLDLLARILEVSLGLVRTSLGLQGLVSGGFTGSLLDLPFGCLRGVLDLVLGPHFCFLPFLPAQPGHKKGSGALPSGQRSSRSPGSRATHSPYVPVMAWYRTDPAVRTGGEHEGPPATRTPVKARTTTSSAGRPAPTRRAARPAKTA